MADFSNLAVTKNGSVLFADVQAGAVLIPTRIVLGSGDMPSEKTTETMTAVVAPVKELAINKRKRSPDGRATFGGMYTNADITEPFYYKEQALFCRAEYRDTSGNVTKSVDEVLFAYGNAGDTADYMPAYNTNAAVERQMDIVVWIGNTVTVELTVESGVYMTQAQAQTIVDAHATNKNNPHGVTKDQVGLGNVPNVTPENQVPSFSNDYNAVTETDGVTSFSNIVNGDLLGAILQKIRTAIYVLISHLNGSNPHKLDAKAVGAAAATHSHDGSDINSGTVGIKYGGTGATTKDAALAALGAAASAHNHNASDINEGTMGLDRLPVVTMPKGGTGATSRTGALVNLNEVPGEPQRATMQYVNLEATGLATECMTTQEVALAMPNDTVITWSHTQNTSVYLSDAPSQWGVVTLIRGFSENYIHGWFFAYDGEIYKFKYHNMNTKKAGWTKVMTNVLSADDYGDELPDPGTPGRIFYKRVT